MGIQIHKPCDQNWEEMKLGVNSKFCMNCSKDVIDFTGKTREEIIQYLINNKSKQVCGRVTRNQIDYTNIDFLITINGKLEKLSKTNGSFLLLSTAALLFSCSNTPSEKLPTYDLNLPKIENIQVYLTDTLVKETYSEKSLKKLKEESSTEIHSIMITGTMIYEPIDQAIKSTAYPYYHLDKMPEYAGGIWDLKDYMDRQLNYPEEERKNNIEGVVSVSFIISSIGEVKNPKITASNVESTAFKDEVIKAIEKMPHWKPGEISGKPVDVEFHLPVKFKLI